MFPRSLKPMDFGDPVQTEIHSFSDASNSGIGQISYLRIVNHTGEVHVSYLPAKSRVAPLKPISIPRLELTAAVISVNVASMLKSELGTEDIKCYHYTDSEIVLGYISSTMKHDASTCMMAIVYNMSETAALRKTGFMSQEEKILLMKPHVA